VHKGKASGGNNVKEIGYGLVSSTTIEFGRSDRETTNLNQESGVWLRFKLGRSQILN
jgi:hypothetical protein